MANKIKTQLTAGRPRSAINKANLPEKDTMKMGELPKSIIGSHMGMISKPPSPTKASGPAIANPPKIAARPPKAPAL